MHSGTVGGAVADRFLVLQELDAGVCTVGGRISLSRVLTNSASGYVSPDILFL